MFEALFNQGAFGCNGNNDSNDQEKKNYDPTNDQD
jgi:hypothetical protein